MVNRVIQIFLTSLLIVCNSYALDAEHPIDVELNACLAKEENMSTAGMANCAIKAIDSWDKEMNIVYNALMKKLDKNAKEKLKASQLAWLKYRDLEYKNIYSIHSKLQGTMFIPVRHQNVFEITKHRALELNSYLSLFKDGNGKSMSG